MADLPPPLLTPPEAAKLLQKSVATLASWRCRGRVDLPFHKIGGAVRYSRVDLDAFLHRHRVERCGVDS